MSNQRSDFGQGFGALTLEGDGEDAAVGAVAVEFQQHLVGGALRRFLGRVSCEHPQLRSCLLGPVPDGKKEQNGFSQGLTQPPAALRAQGFLPSSSSLSHIYISDSSTSCGSQLRIRNTNFTFNLRNLRIRTCFPKEFHSVCPADTGYSQSQTLGATSSTFGHKLFNQSSSGFLMLIFIVHK